MYDQVLKLVITQPLLVEHISQVMYTAYNSTKPLTYMNELMSRLFSTKQLHV